MGIQHFTNLAANFFDKLCFGKRKKRNKILVLIDWENLLINTEVPSLERFSRAMGFDQLIRQLTNIGDIANVFIFIPPHIASPYTEIFQRLGFFIILCPKIKTKEEGKKDTVDEILIELGKKMMDQIPSLTHLCLGSGDKDFVPLIREAIQRRLKIIVAVGSLKSLATDLINLADVNPLTGQKMVYFLSLAKE